MTKACTETLSKHTLKLYTGGVNNHTTDSVAFVYELNKVKEGVILRTARRMAQL